VDRLASDLEDTDDDRSDRLVCFSWLESLLALFVEPLLLAFFDVFRVFAALVEIPSFFASLWVLDVDPLRVALGPLFTTITTGSSSSFV
jgi:hypothetical protein